MPGIIYAKKSAEKKDIQRISWEVVLADDVWFRFVIKMFKK